jgi:small subunit ribosomal protein S24e
MIHPDMANVSKAQIKAKLATTLKAKEENISIFGLKTKFGGGRSTGFALIYDSNDARKKFDSKKMLRRVSFHFFILSRTDTSSRASKEESKEKKSRAESERSEVLLRQRLPPLLVERRSDRFLQVVVKDIFCSLFNSANYFITLNYSLYIRPLS